MYMYMIPVNIAPLHTLSWFSCYLWRIKEIGFHIKFNASAIKSPYSRLGVDKIFKQDVPFAKIDSYLARSFRRLTLFQTIPCNMQKSAVLGTGKHFMKLLKKHWLVFVAYN